ncbi:MAG: preprotein translocase subunit SecE [Clostridiales bacterium]|nr:preprotein translocase subunit SecE [Clostridiales bacterium]
MAKAKEDAVKKTTEAVKKSTGNEKQGLFKRLSQWFKDLKGELKKVIWPTKEQTAKNTAVALVVMLVFAVVLWGFDTLAQTGVKTLISLVG